MHTILVLQLSTVTVVVGVEAVSSGGAVVVDSDAVVLVVEGHGGIVGLLSGLQVS